MPHGFPGTEAADRDAALDHVGDDVDFRVAVDEPPAILLHRRVVERAESTAEQDQILVGQPLPAKQQHLVIEPGPVDRGKDVRVDRPHIDLLHLGAKRRPGGHRRHDHHRATPSTTAVDVPYSRILRVGSMNSELTTPMNSSPAEIRNGIS